jgi:hypothetical protein
MMRGGGTVRPQIWRRSSGGREENESSVLLEVSDSEFSTVEGDDSLDGDDLAVIFSILG